MDPKERNRIQLKKGLQQLPEYQAPANSWEQISRGIEQAKKDEVLHSALKELPNYDAPDHIWNEVQKEISGTAKVRRLSIFRWASAAAVIGLGLFLFFQNESSSHDAFSESISYAKIELSPVEWKGDDPAVNQHVKRVLAAANQQAPTRDDPQVQAIQGSLDQLTAAIAQVEKAGALGGMNDQMKHQLTKMFNKRNQLVRQLAAEI